MRNRGRAGLMAAVCSLAFVGGVAASAHAETLADAIALAYQTNPTLQGQRSTLRSIDEGYVQARSGLRPTASVTANATDTQIKYANPATPAAATIKAGSSGATLSLTQPIYTGGRVDAGIKAAEADVQAGRQNLRRVEQSVLQSVIQAYVDVRRDQQSLAIRQENVTVLTRQRDESKARFDVGEITRTDVAQAEARLAAAQAQLSTAQAQLAISRSTYATVVGQNPGDLAAEPPLASLLPPSVEAAFASAENANPTLLSAQYAERASADRVAVAKAAFRPTIGVRASLGYDASVAGTSIPTNDYDRTIITSAVATIPLFAGGLNASLVRQAQERNTGDRIALESARRNVLQTVSQSWNQLLAARAAITANEEQVRATTIAFEGARQENQVGLRTTLDVLNAEQELRDAQLALVNARHDEYVAGAAVIAAMGHLNAPTIVPDLPAYDPTANFNKVSHAIGWVPWEEAVRVLDKVGEGAVPKAPAPIPSNPDAPIPTR